MGRAARVVALVVIVVATLAAGGWPAGAAAGAGGSAAGAGGALDVGPPGLRADFDGDGFEDLAVGVPLEDVGGVADAGVVDVLYGSTDGLGAGRAQQLGQALAEAGDELGWATAAGDFDDDGVPDLAVGAPSETVGSAPDAGGRATPAAGGAA